MYRHLTTLQTVMSIPAIDFICYSDGMGVGALSEGHRSKVVSVELTMLDRHHLIKDYDGNWAWVLNVESLDAYAGSASQDRWYRIHHLSNNNCRLSLKGESIETRTANKTEQTLSRLAQSTDAIFWIELVVCGYRTRCPAAHCRLIEETLFWHRVPSKVRFPQMWVDGGIRGLAASMAAIALVGGRIWHGSQCRVQCLVVCTWFGRTLLHTYFAKSSAAKLPATLMTMPSLAPPNIDGELCDVWIKAARSVLELNFPWNKTGTVGISNISLHSTNSSNDKNDVDVLTSNK